MLHKRELAANCSIRIPEICAKPVGVGGHKLGILEVAMEPAVAGGTCKRPDGSNTRNTANTANTSQERFLYDKTDQNGHQRSQHDMVFSSHSPSSLPQVLGSSLSGTSHYQIDHRPIE